MIIIRAGLLAKIRWSVCMSKYHRSFSRTAAGIVIIIIIIIIIIKSIFSHVTRVMSFICLFGINLFSLVKNLW